VPDHFVAKKNVLLFFSILVLPRSEALPKAPMVLIKRRLVGAAAGWE
jgi:hypothetical protein